MIKIRLPVKKAGEKKKKIKRDGGFILNEYGVPFCKENVIAVLAYFAYQLPIPDYLNRCSEYADIEINEEKSTAIVYIPYGQKEDIFDPLCPGILAPNGGKYDGYHFELADMFDGKIEIYWNFDRFDVMDIVDETLYSVEEKRNEYD